MVQIDRHIAISAGWVAGPAFGVAMMATPEYIHLSLSNARFCFWGGIGVFVTTIIVLGALSLHDLERQRKMLGPILMMAFGSISFCIGATWYFWPTQSEPLSTLDRTVGVNCYNSTRPTHFREDRLLYIMQVLGPPTAERPIQYSIAITSFMQGRDEIKWSDDFPNQMCKCIISNYGNAPIFRASINLSFIWQEMIKTENGTKSGNVVGSGTLYSPAFDLGVSPRNEDYFYIANLGQFFVTVANPETASTYTADSDIPQTIKLIPPSSSFPSTALFPRPITQAP
jgi:hypothetical protein